MRNNLEGEKEKLAYDGAWMKGRQRLSLPVQKDCQARLENFMAKSKCKYERRIRRRRHTKA
jgi:hypothetical protein